MRIARRTGEVATPEAAVWQVRGSRQESFGRIEGGLPLKVRNHPAAWLQPVHRRYKPEGLVSDEIVKGRLIRIGLLCLGNKSSQVLIGVAFSIASALKAF